MKLEGTFAGLEARLHSTGGGRFFGAGFLLVWLGFWGFGEVFVIWILAMGGWALVTGTPPEPGREPLAAGPALGVGAFLLAWLAFWTIGGFAAWHEFMRLIWSSDRLIATPAGLEIVRRTGLFTRRQRLPREQLRRLYRLPAGSRLQADTADGPVELTRLGTAADQDEIAAALSRELKLTPESLLPPLLPADWREIAAPEGGSLLVGDPATRRRQARLAWTVALPLCVVALVLFDAATRDGNLYALALVASAVALALTWGAVWLTFTRNEWLLGDGYMVQQRRLGSRVRHRFEGRTLELSDSRDSDGDNWFFVEIVAPTPPGASARERRRARRSIHKAMHDVTESRRLVDWLSARTGMPVKINLSSSPNTADIAALKRQLAATGRFGRAAARLLDRIPTKS